MARALMPCTLTPGGLGVLLAMTEFFGWTACNKAAGPLNAALCKPQVSDSSLEGGLDLIYWSNTVWRTCLCRFNLDRLVDTVIAKPRCQLSNGPVRIHLLDKAGLLSRALTP